jgi:hypothetical protein
LSGFEFGVVAVLLSMVVLRALIVLVFAAAIIRPVRSCPACFRDTLPVRKRLLTLLAPAFEWRWCPSCSWQGLGRKVPDRAPALPSRRPQTSRNPD